MPCQDPHGQATMLLSSPLCPQFAARPTCCLQDDAGAVTGATCKLGWEKGSRTAIAVSRAISQFGVAHADSAGEPVVQFLSHAWRHLSTA